MRGLIQILLISLLSPPLQAQQIDPEWPCIQVLVPKIVIAVVWPQPVDPASSAAIEKRVAALKAILNITAFVSSLSTRIISASSPVLRVRRGPSGLR